MQSCEIVKMYDANQTVFADSVPEAFDVTCSGWCLLSVAVLLVLGATISMILLVLAVSQWAVVSQPGVGELPELSDEERTEVMLLLRWNSSVV